MPTDWRSPRYVLGEPVAIYDGHWVHDCIVVEYHATGDHFCCVHDGAPGPCPGPWYRLRDINLGDAWDMVYAEHEIDSYSAGISPITGEEL